ncbi:hypothetical protein [Sphingobium sp.]|uniref:hypothetical protein n=1 Tax=Sphingobium sp. TaxID=1912891 RepID=UPI000DB5D2F0|nr:hypothetical protein [Sphingobium sp.]PZU63169.1 MAG: hypothetical protein DI540_24595 [Sphingobium sp.]
MNAVAKLLSIIGAMTLLSSCSPPPIDIAVERIDGRMLLRLSQDWGMIFSDKQVPCVREVGLYEPEHYDRSKAAWLIEVRGDVQCLDLASVTVGKLPKGWQEVVRLSTSGGLVYTIRAHGIGWGETNARF